MSVLTEQIKPETIALIERQAETFGLSVDDYLQSLLPKNENDLALKNDSQNNDFEADMLEFAENTEMYQGSYSREDIYFDHD
jgi:hypothetical protein